MDVYQLDPFGNELIVTKLTGNEIRSLMVSAFTIDERAPVYPSGIKTELRLDAKGELEDITLLTESGSPLDMDRTYTVAMNSYMSQVYKYNHSDPGQSLFIETADATIAYLKKIRNVRSYSSEKRIQIDR
ncbi:MAG: 5'-nucleotidase C-terminal domain-containing protein, partial [Bacteroidales bacterium]|nr:5'-nucleotidase C-terminal domain-containing protein [Bacteroidales bacterium]